MATDYVAAQRRFVRFKSALTRAQNTKNPHNVLLACKVFFEHYNRVESEPFPDDWHRWERAQDDATFALQRLEKWRGI